MNRSYSKIRHIQEANLKLEKKYLTESKTPLNESVLLTLAGVALGAGLVKKAYDYVTNKQLENKMEETGNTKESYDENGEMVTQMKEYKDNDTGEIFWGVDIVDKSNYSEGRHQRKVLLFKDDPERIEKILNYYKDNKGTFFGSDEDAMSDDHHKKFGPFIADKSFSKGRE